MIINSSYFLNKSVFIPNAVVQPSIGSNTPTSINQLNEEIDQKEYELILSWLGYEQTKDLFDQFEVNGDWKPTALQKWKDFVDGKEDWRGLRYSAGTKKISVIAFYVFFYYLKNDFVQYSTTGIQSPVSENSISQLPNEKQTQAWNTFVNMTEGDLIADRNYSFSRNWNGLMLRWTGNEKNEASVYAFLSKNTDVYDLSFFNHNTIINPYNL